MKPQNAFGDLVEELQKLKGGSTLNKNFTAGVSDNFRRKEAQPKSLKALTRELKSMEKSFGRDARMAGGSAIETLRKSLPDVMQNSVAAYQAGEIDGGELCRREAVINRLKSDLLDRGIRV